MTAGYSGTPLIKKLGIKPGFRVYVINPPANYFDLLGDLPPDVHIMADPAPELDFIHLFTRSRSELEAMFAPLRDSLHKAGMLWVSWPKQAAKVETDLTGNSVREIGLAGGLVDVKVAAIDATWSGLKFVYRVEDR